MQTTNSCGFVLLIFTFLDGRRGEIRKAKFIITVGVVLLAKPENQVHTKSVI
jgi:hypothetical protein